MNDMGFLAVCVLNTTRLSTGLAIRVRDCVLLQIFRRHLHVITMYKTLKGDS